MLNNDSLSQLKQLKKQIVDAKEYAEGTVKSTQRRFGFAVLDDEREVFLSPDEMEKVFPGDRVKVEILTDKKGKQSATITKLLGSSLENFCGRYVVKGKGHFVEPDLPRFSRWIFVPPQARNGAKDGDYIHCRISRHPFPAGKPQAKVLQVIGNTDKPGIEPEYMACKFELGGNWPKQWLEQLSEDSTEREDRTATPFVTIDAPSTQDMDDALWAEATDNGWQLSIAIADPSAMLAAGSALDQEALRRATSVYMPGFTIPMLPEELSNRRCSLTPGDERPAMVCDMQVDSSGKITDYRLSLATVRSSAKLSYQDVAAFIDQQQPIEGVDVEALISPLVAVTRALLDQRKRDHLVVEGRPEFRLVLNAERKIDRIEPLVKTSAHQLVEECMVAANRCAADFMGEQGLFSGHAGFRSERLEGVTKLAEEQAGISDVDLASLDGYRQLINAIDDEQPFPTRSVLARMLERGQLSSQPTPHFGMGLERYTTFTSPIRKYSDLLVHRQIKAKLQQQNAEPISEQTLAQIQAGLDAARQARQQMEQWLKCQYLASDVGKTASGTVCQINSNGFTVRLDNGVEGFVDTRLLKEKYSFDPLRLRLSGPTMTVELEQQVDIVIQEVDDKQRTIQFTLPAQDNAPA